MKRIIVLLLALLMLLSLAACGAQLVDDNAADEPSMEQEVTNPDDQRDEVSGDNMTGIGTGDVENTDVGVVTPNPDAAKDENPNAQKPEQDKTPVEDDKEPEQEKEDTTPLATTPDDDKEETPPVTTPDDSGSGSSGSGSSGNSGSSGTAEYNGTTIRAFPAGTDVNSITPQKPGEKVYIGDTVYLWNGSIWGVKDTSVPPNQSSIVNGDPFSGSQGMH